MAKRRKTQDEKLRDGDDQDDDYIPLPIQIFLWRQTSPFVRPSIGKSRDLAHIEQRDSCKLFERVIVTNNIWGQSLGLTDAIASIDRWQLIKVSFPFVLQCTASLLNNKLIRDRTFNRLGGNESKMMYTLQWMLMTAAEECVDSENEAKERVTTTQACATAASLLKPTTLSLPQTMAGASPQSRSNTDLSQQTQQQQQQQGSPYQQPLASQGSTSSTCTYIDQQQQQQQQQPAAEDALLISAKQQHKARLSSTSSCNNQSLAATTTTCQQIAPSVSAAASAAATVVAATGITNIKPVLPTPSSQNVSPLGPSTPTKPSSTTLIGDGGSSGGGGGASSQQQQHKHDTQGFVIASNVYLLPISSIQMFVHYFAPIMDNLKHSDFLSTNQRLEAGSDLWEPLFNHQLPDIHCLKAPIKPHKSLRDTNEFAIFTHDERKFVATQTTGQPVQSTRRLLREAADDDRRRSLAMMMIDQSQAGDVFFSGPNLSTSSQQSCCNKVVPGGYSSNVDTMVAAATARPITTSASKSVSYSKHDSEPSTNAQYVDRVHTSTDSTFVARKFIGTSSATYLDVAVLRCLSMGDWPETGVYWALTYISNRIYETNYSNDSSQASLHLRFKIKSKSTSCLNMRASDTAQDASATATRTHRRRRRSSAQQQQIAEAQVETSAQRVKRPLADKTAMMNEQHMQQSTSSRYLRVEDAETSDSGDNAKDAGGRNSARRLSFTSGMQTIANQIRKTSKRVKKPGDAQQQHQQQHKSDSPSDAAGAKARARRRSSSMDELSSTQASALSLLHKESLAQENASKEFHPLITVTTNAPSSKQQASKFSEYKNSKPVHKSRACEFDRAGYMHSPISKQLSSLMRSQTIPRDMHFSPFTTLKDQSTQSESVGAMDYIDDDEGKIDPIAVLKILHSISKRENACSQRVCDKVLSLAVYLIKIGILKSDYASTMQRKSSKNIASLLPTRVHAFKIIDESAHVIEMDSQQEADKQRRKEQAARQAMQIHRMFVDMIFRLSVHLGCPNNCGMEATVDAHAQGHHTKCTSTSGKIGLSANDITTRALRAKLRETLEYLCAHNKQSFVDYTLELIDTRTIQKIIDTLHTLLGFCRNDYISQVLQSGPSNHANLSSKLSHRSEVQFASTSTGWDECRPHCMGSVSSALSDSSYTTEIDLRQQHAAAAAAAAKQTKATAARKSSEPVESIIITSSFLKLVTRLANLNKELKTQENTALNCDIRKLISFTRDNYNSVFRSVVLSALIDSTRILNQQQQQQQQQHQQQQQQQPKSSQHEPRRHAGDVTRPPSDDESCGANAPSSGSASNRRVQKAGESMGDLRETSAAAAVAPQSPSSKGAANEYSPLSQGGHMYHRSAKLMSTLGAATGSQQTDNAPSHQSSGILSLSKAKKKLEQVFGGAKQAAGSKGKLNSAHLGEDLTQSGSIGPVECEMGLAGVAGVDEASRRASIIGHQSIGSFTEQPARVFANIAQSPLGQHHASIQMLKRNQMLYMAVQKGMSNFSFLMESCSPGDFMDPALLAALLDLKSPVAVRAAIFIECANFVHRCNRGQWPAWMKMSVATASGHRGSTAGLNQSFSAASRMRKSSSIQRAARNNTLMYRAAGRAFYAWAEALGTRMEELIAQDQNTVAVGKLTDTSAIAEDSEMTATDGETSNQAASEQGACTSHASQAPNDSINCTSADVDFFQPSINGNSSPFVLKMAACQLLFEVTTFLRDTYKYLPPTLSHHQAVSSKLGDKMSSIYDVSRAVTANRRWSMALSSLGFGQLPAISAGASGVGPTPSSSATGSHLMKPTQSAISEQPERRISFILHEKDDEHEQDATDKHKQDGDRLSASNAAVVGASQASPIASTVNTIDQQQDAMKKMTAGRPLSQSSATSAVVVAAATCLLRQGGVIDSQAHRRKSIKLKKPSQDKEQRDKKTKFTQDLDEENENSSVSDAGIRRTDSLRSRRRVSGISEKSDTSDRPSNGPAPEASAAGPQSVSTTATQAAVAEASGDESAGNNSAEDAYESAERAEADDNRIMSNMPWFKAIAMLNACMDCNCSHFPACKSNCYKSSHSACKKLIACVQWIYRNSIDEQNHAVMMLESQLAKMIEAACQKQQQQQSSKVDRAGSDCSNFQDSETKRKEKKLKRHAQLDSPLEDSINFSPKVKRNQQVNNRVLSLGSGVAHRDSIVGLSGVIAINDIIATMMTESRLSQLQQQRRGSRTQPAEELQIIKYMRYNVKNLLHCPMASFLKGATILTRDSFIDMIKFSWNLLLEDDQHLSRTAAACFIISSIKCPAEASKILLDELESTDASRKIAAINKFYVIWDARYQCWPRLEDGAFVNFKMTPPSIEFTLPSPKIAQESKPVVDPPWMPKKTSNVEEVTINQDQSVQNSFVTATKTRRKQQIEIVTKALREKHDKLREDRENYHITSVPITSYAAYGPAAGGQSGGDDAEGAGGGIDEETQLENRALLHIRTAHPLFPTCLCKAPIVMINLLDDSRVTYEGSAVYEIASKVIWSCLAEDPALFLRHFFEGLTRQNQNTIFQVLRRLIRFMPRLPPQAAYTLYNYLIGFIIYFIRCPVESSQKLIADTLSVLCLVVPSVYGLFLKDLKQILRKEQCDHNLLITANVPSAKRIIIHSSDSSGIPSQCPIDEATQFYHILVDSFEFFGIEEAKRNEYFLVDFRTNHMHNLHAYVRDYYSFKRSQHPQLQMVNMAPSKAFDILQQQELINQFLEFGKVSMSLSIVKSSHMAVQRVLFLHEELMKLPTFPRRALETNFSLFRGPMGHQVFSMDRIHKICWVRVIARMFELTSGFFLQLGDIQLFLNAISGIFVLHCEEASVSRLCLATFINATHQFKSIFAADGFLPIMSTIVLVYSNHQTNHLLCRSIEFVCKQFYIMHRKPFLLQLFGSIAPKLNTAEILELNQADHPLSTHPMSSRNSNFSDPSRISPSAFFRLLQSLDKAFKDPLDILELVDAEKPLRAIDFCYQQDKESIEILDIISLCVTVTAYASESPRSTQMLIILESVVPLYMKHLQACSAKKSGQSKQAHKDELQKIQSISVCIRTLIINCEGLTRNFSGPLPYIDFRSSSIRRPGHSVNRTTSNQHPRNPANSAGSPMDVYVDEPSVTGTEKTGRRGDQGGRERDNATKQAALGSRGNRNYNTEESEITRGEFIVPRDTLLNLVAEFLSLSTARLVESAKKYVELHQKHSSYELLDVKSHLRLAEVANSLLKFASTDPSVLACRGLIRYMNEILPNTEWRQEAIRPALIMILKRLDKTFNRIAKKTWVKRSTDWEAAKQLLKGAYLTFVRHPYIVHLPHLKSLISCCQNIILSDGLNMYTSPIATTLFHNLATSASGVMVSQSASAIGHQNADKSLLTVGTSNVYGPGSSLSPSGSGAHSSSAPAATHTQAAPSLAALTSASALAERLASSVSGSTTTSQGFNSVTIRLIAMQLLQTGDSQTLESFIGNSMNTPEKVESVLLNLIYPMCIRVCSGAREAPKLRTCDIMYILNVVLGMLAPQSASSKSCSAAANSPKVANEASQFILSKITTTIGSTQTGATALGIVGSSAHVGNVHASAQHPHALKIGFLGLKILCVCFEQQLASEWLRVSRVIRDLVLQPGAPSGPLWDFLDFVATYRFPVYILLLPTMKCQLRRKAKCEPQSGDKLSHYIQCKRLIDAKIECAAPTACRSKSFLFVSLTAELRIIKEQLVSKRRQHIENDRQASNVTSHASQQQQQQQQAGGSGGGLAGNAGGGSLSPNQTGQSGEGDHFTAYHRLSAAIASFANQNTQAKQAAAAAQGQQLSASAALRGACFAAQLATSTPLAPHGDAEHAGGSRNDSLQGSMRLPTTKTREEARRVMNTILRRTSYPHNAGATDNTSGAEQAPTAAAAAAQPASSGSSSSTRPSNADAEDGSTSANPMIMDPAMLMAAFPMPRKQTTEGSGILKQLIQTIDKQNSNKMQQQQQQQQ